MWEQQRGPGQHEAEFGPVTGSRLGRGGDSAVNPHASYGVTVPGLEMGLLWCRTREESEMSMHCTEA